jgi:NADH-quinone oxidoreductase subunit L
MEIVKYIPVLSALAMVLCGLCCIVRPMRVLAPVFTIAALLGSFAIMLNVSTAGSAPLYQANDVSPDLQGRIVHLFTWLDMGALPPLDNQAGQAAIDGQVAKPVVQAAQPTSINVFVANVSFFIDPLTMLMLAVITGIGTLIAIYAAGYMKGDPGYARFFAYVSLFILAMTCLVMADNLVLVYFGWEGVGLASYLLIGFYYKKPSAVAAAKKAFIVNRIGDFGFALGIFAVYWLFGSVEFKVILPAAQAILNHGIDAAQKLTELGGSRDYVIAATENYKAVATVLPCLPIIAPFLLLMGALGKSAQFPLFVWLPDAMEGPTPVSALIHAATMVTSGVYLIARMSVVFQLSEWALPTVAVIGALTAILGAVIALAQNDLKRVWAYSTVSQLGYMFLGVGVLSAYAGVFHLVSHAFFKALLFLTAGSVMHALAGQLDLSKISGLLKKMPVTGILMLIGALALAGFPGTSGFFSKDEILAAAFNYDKHGSLGLILGIVGLLTAFVTAFYAFRLWFRVFVGPTQYEMGDDHGHHAPAPADHADSGIKVEHHQDAHEVSWLMNGPLILLAIGALGFGFFGPKVLDVIMGSSGRFAQSSGEGHVVSHHAMMAISSVVAILGIGLAAWLHWFSRSTGDAAAKALAFPVKLLTGKLYVDEIYDCLIVRPLKALSGLLFVFDRIVVENLVSLVGAVPSGLGYIARIGQKGSLQGYALGMSFGLAVVAFLVYRLIY